MEKCCICEKELSDNEVYQGSNEDDILCKDCVEVEKDDIAEHFAMQD